MDARKARKESEFRNFSDIKRRRKGYYFTYSRGY